MILMLLAVRLPNRNWAPTAAAAPGDPMDSVALIERFLAELPGLHGFVERMGVSSADGDDLIQEVFLVFYRRRADYDPLRPLAPWLRGIAYRLTLEHFKTRRQQPVLEPVDLTRVRAGAPDPESRAVVNEGLAIVRAALTALPLKLRAVFIMHEIDGLEMREVARALGIPRFTAYSRLRLARAKFARAARHRMGDQT